MVENQDNAFIDIEYEDEINNEEEQKKIDKLLMEKKIMEYKNKEFNEKKLPQIQLNQYLNNAIEAGAFAAKGNVFNFFGFFGKNPEPVAQPIVNVLGKNNTAGPTDDKSIIKRIEIKKNVYVNNI